MTNILIKSILIFVVVAWKCNQVTLISPFHTNKMHINISVFKQLEFMKTIVPNLKLTTNAVKMNISTIGDLHREWVSRFKLGCVPEPEESARHIIGHAIGVTKPYKYEIIQNDKITEEQEKTISHLCECRLARMPVQYIIKEWDFRDLRLIMRPPVFIPRPETEQLVGLVVEEAQRNALVLEIGCGSGAISLSLLKCLPDCRVVAVDQSKMACQLTLDNAQLNRLTNKLQVIRSKLRSDGSFSNVLPLEDGTVDVIVSNPPYVPYPQMANLAPEIKLYEDLRALEAGPDGMRVIKALLQMAPALLKPGGSIFLEVDSCHPPLIEKWLTIHPDLGISFVKTTKDYCDRDRFVELKKV